MTIRLKAKFDGKAFVPLEPADVPVDTIVELDVHDSSPPAPKHVLLEMLELAEQFPANPDAATDAAAQHDHYLYGTPKREHP